MATQNIYNMTDTWTGGALFTAIKMNVTDTSSDSSSLLIDLQVGGSSQFSILKNGAVTARGMAVTVNDLALQGGGTSLKLNSAGDGTCLMTNHAGDGFTSLRLGPAGGAGCQNTLLVRKTGIANNSATSMITVTVPNSAHNAAIFLDILAHLGTGTDASESSRCATGAIVLARTSGADTVATAATLTTAQIATVSGGGTLTLAYGVSSISGLSSATQTFNITLTLVVTGTITDHTAVISARLLNSLATGVTMAAAA